MRNWSVYAALGGGAGAREGAPNEILDGRLGYQRWRQFLVITVESVAKRYGDSVVVDDVSLEIPAGGITSIIGPNGAGKSTLLSIVSRLEPMSAGVVTVDGMDVSTTKSPILAKRLAILRQENHLTVRLSVRDLVAFGRFPHSQGRLTKDDVEFVDKALDYMGLTELQDRYIDELSGGQRQRAYVAMVICQDTDYVLLDEPLNNLDMKHSVNMMQHLRRIATELGKTILFVVHDINFASVYSDRMIAMRDGRVIVQGTPEEVMDSRKLAAIYDMYIPIHEIEGERLGIYYWSPALPTAAKLPADYRTEVQVHVSPDHPGEEAVPKTVAELSE
ncbi:Ferric siderophore ABC transporter ATP-binding protein BauE [Gulosibacter molinativorax]|uniref:iron ABC transporter ATP-binding protein n=1 Tax=Gulosibacter molinativorax TaxID=256821 RepID=UPI0026888C3B|nr:Ferric siderophore ABC transporter ATP-binding protein BauE [Gulosibacter molinativorax]